jgi:hypothetical protein
VAQCGITGGGSPEWVVPPLWWGFLDMDNTYKGSTTRGTRQGGLQAAMTSGDDWVVAPDFGGVRGGLQGFFQRRRRGSGSYSSGQFSAERLETAR